MNENARLRLPSHEAVRDFADLSAARGGMIGGLCGVVLWAVLGLVLTLLLRPF